MANYCVVNNLSVLSPNALLSLSCCLGCPGCPEGWYDHSQHRHSSWLSSYYSNINRLSSEPSYSTPLGRLFDLRSPVWQSPLVTLALCHTSQSDLKQTAADGADGGEWAIDSKLVLYCHLKPRAFLSCLQEARSVFPFPKTSMSAQEFGWTGFRPSTVR